MIPVVLLAEDDEQMRRMLNEHLQRRGFVVVEVADGYELLAYVTLARSGGELPEPDAVVTDLNLPGADGLRALEGFGHLERVVLISAFADPMTLERARAAGIHTVLAKPFAVEALVAEVERVVGR
ncbi:MAG: response regulator [Myxococcaceae bacterium]